MRISCAFLQTASATGRLATEAPNLQCMPRARDFLVPDTQTPSDGGPRRLHTHSANLRCGAAHRCPGKERVGVDLIH